MRPRTTIAALGMVAALAGCSLIQSKDPAKGGGAGEPGGQLIAPKRCALKVAVLSRPLNDPALNEALWRGADEQAVPAEVRRVLEANGLRLGVATGDLPSEVRSVIDAPPPHKVDPKTILLPDGDRTIVELKPPEPQVSLLLNRDGKAVGKDYRDAKGSLRLTATRDGEAGVSLRIVPEVHHGPVTHRFAADSGAGAFSPQQFLVKDGQEEETFRELAATVTLGPNRVAVLGSLPSRRHSLGDFLMTEAEAGSDRLQQKVVLIWASAAGAEPPPPSPAAPPPRLEPVDPPDAGASVPKP